ncbi:DUF2946 domain-containing protein [Erwinia psidii]|uniref:DUF2946 domain-containing protein n=2 Tax=Erwinia psidii TaxID=69224 RepID=A0A3N6S771_9GAMM|nr:DUF2946 domain-containing protein [Erwinia psidii]MCX8962686.1 DUF2946 domain-containing protein [Erwinia psidii]MCX8964282.1 DUF2946 domain-containing protein [Erwinia psidii]RQM36930.1 DUF2946 domain-containing protein [Erwinia psidii]
MLLLLLAPVISKSLDQTPARHAMMMAMMPGMTMHHMPGMTTNDISPERTMQDHPASMMDDSACGYCVLLTHLPLDLTTLPPLCSALQAASFHALPLFQPVVSRFTPRFFHPRAPPRTAP